MASPTFEQLGQIIDLQQQTIAKLSDLTSKVMQVSDYLESIRKSNRNFIRDKNGQFLLDTWKDQI